MNLQNGEIYACVNVPEFDLNHPFDLGEMDTSGLSEQEIQDARNQMWRNGCINDTYEPGSVFKIITMSAGLEEGVVHPSDSFYCPGYCIVEDRRIRCHKVGGHGSEDFVHWAMNSCNPVFITEGLRSDRCLLPSFSAVRPVEKTGIDLLGRGLGRSCIRRKICGTRRTGDGFLWTVLSGDFRYSWQGRGERPDQRRQKELRTILASRYVDRDGTLLKVLEYPQGEPGILSEETSETVRGS